ncbi:MAG: PPOX class F420-dependent oxidoreductase [Dehalococcoidia bacterium]
MTASIPASHRDIIEGKNLAHVATLGKDGLPQSTPVWIDIEGDTLVINTAEGRVKTRNLDRNPNVAISIHDSANLYRYIQVRGVVSERTTVGADANIDKLAKKYLGVDAYPGRAANPSEQRVIFRIKPTSVQVMG